MLGKHLLQVSDEQSQEDGPQEMSPVLTRLDEESLQAAPLPHIQGFEANSQIFFPYSGKLRWEKGALSAVACVCVSVWALVSQGGTGPSNAVCWWWWLREESLCAARGCPSIRGTGAELSILDLHLECFPRPDLFQGAAVQVSCSGSHSHLLEALEQFWPVPAAGWSPVPVPAWPPGCLGHGHAAQAVPAGLGLGRDGRQQRCLWHGCAPACCSQGTGFCRISIS